MILYRKRWARHIYYSNLTNSTRTLSPCKCNQYHFKPYFSRVYSANINSYTGLLAALRIQDKAMLLITWGLWRAFAFLFFQFLKAYLISSIFVKALFVKSTKILCLLNKLKKKLYKYYSSVNDYMWLRSLRSFCIF